MTQLIKSLCLRIKSWLQQQKDNVMNQINSWKFGPIFVKKKRGGVGLIQAPYEAYDKTSTEFSPLYKYACTLIYALLEQILAH